MSWKSFVSAGLLCVLASPVFAQPTVQITPGGTFANGHLNAAGNWVWQVRLSQSSPLVDLTGVGGITTPGSPLAAELGFSETSSELLGVTVTNPAEFDDPNPGNPIFGTFNGTSYSGWETISDTDNGDADNNPATGVEFNGDDEPVGLQFSTAFDQIFAALGSVDYGTDADGKDFITIEIQGPSTTGSLETDLVMLGAYGGNGRIAELNQAWDPSDNNPSQSLNYDSFAGTFSRMAQGGDADLNGVTNFFDLQTLLGSYNQPGQWQDGDSTGDGTVNFFDLQALLGEYNQTYSVNSGAGGGSGGGAVPEPASAFLMVLAGSFILAARRMRG